MSPVEVSKPQKFSEKESTESHKAEFPDANLVMDSRLCYNMEIVVCSLLQVMVRRGLLTLKKQGKSRKVESLIYPEGHQKSPCVLFTFKYLHNDGNFKLNL